MSKKDGWASPNSVLNILVEQKAFEGIVDIDDHREYRKCPAIRLTGYFYNAYGEELRKPEYHKKLREFICRK